MIKLQVRSLNHEFEVIVTKKLKLLWVTPFKFNNKKEALEFIKKNELSVIDEYQRRIECQKKEAKE